MSLLKRSQRKYLVTGRRRSKVSRPAASHFHVYKTASSFADIVTASRDPLSPSAATCYYSFSFKETFEVTQKPTIPDLHSDIVQHRHNSEGNVY